MVFGLFVYGDVVWCVWVEVDWVDGLFVVVYVLFGCYYCVGVECGWSGVGYWGWCGDDLFGFGVVWDGLFGILFVCLVVEFDCED